MQEKLPSPAQIEAERFKRSFYLFTKEAFKILHPGQSITDNWHIRYLCDTLQSEIERINRGENKTSDIIINIPPRSLKSFIATVALPAWTWTLDPRLKFIGSSYSAELSIEHNVMSRRMVESEWYQERWGVTISSDQNTKGKFENTLQGFRKATSTGGTVTGTGGDIIIIDDPLNPKEAASEAERTRANTHFDLTLSTRLNQPERGLFIVIMQRLHEDDLTGHLLKRNPEGWRHICIPGELSNDVQPEYLSQNYTDGLFFPERFTRSFLNSLRTALGSYGYAGQILQRPSPDEGGKIKKAWFQKFTMDKIPNETPWHFTCDTAYTEKETNDPSGILTYAFHNNNWYIRDWTCVRKEFPELCRMLPSHCQAHGYTNQSIVEVEPKSSGKSLVQTLRRETGMNIRESENPTKDKVARVEDIAATVEAGRVYLLEGQNWVDNFLSELAQFPNGAHDEAPDCLVMMINRHLKKRGMLAFGIG